MTKGPLAQKVLGKVPVVHRFSAVKIMNYAFNILRVHVLAHYIRMYILNFIGMTLSYVDAEGVMCTPVQYVQYVIKIV